MKSIGGCDGSHHSVQALTLLALLLRRRIEKMTVYYSIPDSVVKAPQTTFHTMFQEARPVLTKSVLEGAKDQLVRAISIHLMPDRIDPLHGLVLIAGRLYADSIAVSARRLGPGKRLMLGSVSRAVML